MVQRSTVREQAINLRKGGKSYSQISKSLNVTKSTLSSWFSGLAWSDKIRQGLSESQQNRPNNLRAANAARQKITNKRHQGIISQSKKEFLILKNNPLFLVGLSLYWGEGEKTESGRVSVINTDPEMVVVMANFYRKCLGVEEKNLRVGLFVYEDLDLPTVVNFWEKILHIPRSQFIKTQVLKSRSKQTQRKSKYGICSLYFSNTAVSIKIKQWIKLLSTLSGISLPVK